MTDLRKKIAGVTVIILPVFTLLVFLSKEYLIELSRFLPECQFYNRTGYLCPACGNTRSIKALFRGDILISMRYNITPILLLVFVVLFYIECSICAFGVEKHIIPRKYWVLTFILTFLTLYYLLRNFIPILTLCT